MGRGPPIYDGTARALLVQIRQGRLDLIGILADHVEELGDERGDCLRIVLRCYDARLRSYGPGYEADVWNWLRVEVGSMFGRRWQWLYHAEVVELMGRRWP
jgi:hypothetical protein